MHQRRKLNMNDGQFNCLSLIFIKSHINKSIRGSIPKCSKFEDFMKTIEEQFVRSNKALTSILMKRFSSKTFEYSKRVHEHIMEMRDMAAQLKSLEVDISSSQTPQDSTNKLPAKRYLWNVRYLPCNMNTSTSEVLVSGITSCGTW